MGLPTQYPPGVTSGYIVLYIPTICTISAMLALSLFWTGSTLIRVHTNFLPLPVVRSLRPIRDYEWQHWHADFIHCREERASAWLTGYTALQVEYMTGDLRVLKLTIKQDDSSFSSSSATLPTAPRTSSYRTPECFGIISWACSIRINGAACPIWVLSIV